MREANFSIPNVNKASVGITTALYDRRALDCTSTLPLINSLNHLAYLTTSSARIRDILTVDGGIEKLVSILKQGRSKDVMEMWKWNLAFQCVVNIGVRGTEAVRTRVVEADMVPVIATILDNYIKVTDKLREKAEEKHRSEHHRHRLGGSRVHKSSSFSSRAATLDVDQRTFRRQAPPPSIDVSATLVGPSVTVVHSNVDATPTAPQFQLAPTPTADRAPLTATTHRPHQFLNIPSPAPQTAPPVASTVPSMDIDGLASRANRDLDRFGGIMPPPTRPAVMASQPTSPTTPLPPPHLPSPTVRPTSVTTPTARARRRPSIRHQHSTGGETDDMNAESITSEESPADTEMSGTAEMQTPLGVQEITVEDGDSMMTNGGIELTTPTASEAQEATAFNITHEAPVEGSIPPTNTQTNITAMGLSPNRPTIMVSPPTPAPANASVPRYLLDRQLPNPQMLAGMPREEDVLMSLQLLAYVSKYCNLRKYFQKTHFVPKLMLGREIELLDGIDPASIEADLEKQDAMAEEEYCMPNDVNIFPIVERFTVRHHSTDMQYWAGVVMRNLCRKDDTRGGIRQCAYYQCGKWEEFTRQFAKCRRCRRTKYCSKECQKSAWAFHRHWCIAATQ
ncbi:putative mynd-type zinc finger protein [Thermochaetoides thermophila DSM 1495]|uniref:MYND-type zinc finger protein samB n=1 Tax=Chaetomium thermophilum (strain DSM 1495 / CBS 144.50 / IMI 039719) TaxID=759272 RepID=G0SGC3_CHATD|nr:putative mynd-type zinc finger protein [Thermochaetoides thermophila DSM 1495]EGS17262.1 putative mynd-type zinc finger protein [Thermochaetoides thermophila DSM 1495]